MKKLLCLALSLLLMLTGVSAFADSEPMQALLVLGDSIATGAGLDGYVSGDNRSANSFGNQLASAAFGQYAYANLAVDGLDSAGLLASLQGYAGPIAMASDIVISIGGNDVLGPALALMKTTLGLPESATNEQLVAAIQTNPNAVMLISAAMVQNVGMFAAKAQAYASNLAQIAGGIRMINPEADVYMLTLYNPFSGVPSFQSLSAVVDQLFESMNLAIVQISERADFDVVNVATAFENMGPYYTGIQTLNVHPNAQGHARIFRMLYDMLEVRPITSISIKCSTLKVGQSKAIAVTVKPTKATEKPLLMSANPGVATVDENGVVTGVSAGKAILYAVAPSNFQVTAKCVVTVKGAIGEQVGFSYSLKTASNPTKADGSLSVLPSGGSGRYDISIDGGTTWKKNLKAVTYTFKKLKAGTYQVVVRDAKNIENYRVSTLMVLPKLNAPVVTAKADVGCVSVGWTVDAQATRVEVWRATKSNGTYSLLTSASVSQPGYIDLAVSANAKYYYKVRAVDQYGAKSAYSKVVSAKVPLAVK